MRTCMYQVISSDCEDCWDDEKCLEDIKSSLQKESGGRYSLPGKWWNHHWTLSTSLPKEKKWTRAELSFKLSLFPLAQGSLLVEGSGPGTCWVQAGFQTYLLPPSLPLFSGSEKKIGFLKIWHSLWNPPLKHRVC